MSVKVGERGMTVGRLIPAGEIDIRGNRHPARADFGTLDPNTPIVVTGSNEFGLIVRPATGGEPELDPSSEFTTPVERIDERADQTAEVLEQAREEVRNFLIILLALPVLCGVVFGAVGYWTGDTTGAIIGALTGIVIGTCCLLKMWLAS